MSLNENRNDAAVHPRFVRRRPARRRVAAATATLGAALLAVTLGVSPALAAPPVNTTPPTLTGSSLVGKQLTCNPGVWTQQNRIGNYIFRWLRDGVQIVAPSPYRVRYITVEDDIGSDITCRVKRKNTNGTSAEVGSNAISVVAPALPENTIAPSLIGNGNFGTRLSCSPGSWTESGYYTFTWQRDGVTFANPAQNPKQYTVQNGDADSEITCTVTRTSVHGTSDPAVSNEVEVGPLPIPENTFPPQLIGSGLLGEPLKCLAGLWTENGAYQYTWLRDGTTVIPNPDHPKRYRPVSADVGHQITCSVTRSNQYGTSDPAVSNAILVQ